jgi:hypothetical protein
VPHKPLAPTKKSAAFSWIEVSYQAPLTGGSPIIGYRVYKDGVQVSDLTALELMITSNIEAGVIYQISVAAYNAVGEG